MWPVDVPNILAIFVGGAFVLAACRLTNFPIRSYWQGVFIVFLSKVVGQLLIPSLQRLESVWLATVLMYVAVIGTQWVVTKFLLGHRWHQALAVTVLVWIFYGLLSVIVYVFQWLIGSVAGGDVASSVRNAS